MDDDTGVICKNCRYCKLTVKAKHISFRCIKHSWPCETHRITCEDFRSWVDELAYAVISYAWFVVGNEG